MRVDGNWKLELDVPAGPREVTVRLTSVGRFLSGVWSDGTVSHSFDGGTVNNGSLSWEVPAHGLRFDAQVDKNEMSGTVEMSGGSANGQFHGRRVA